MKNGCGALGPCRSAFGLRALGRPLAGAPYDDGGVERTGTGKRAENVTTQERRNAGQGRQEADTTGTEDDERQGDEREADEECSEGDWTPGTELEVGLGWNDCIRVR